MKTALITGANRGIGLQTATQLLARGFRVYLGTRSANANGKQVEDLEGEAQWLTIDVAHSSSISSAAQWLIRNEEHLDVLINNAAISSDEGLSITNISREQLTDTFHVNTFGPIEVTQALLSLLRNSESARVINVSSGYGQMESLSADVPSYCLSKHALNGITRMLAEKLMPEGISVNAVCPGWVRTDMGGSAAPRSVDEGAAGIVWLAAEAPQGLTGKFFRDGEAISW